MLTTFDNVFTPEASWQALDVLIKLGLGALLGGIIGMERERSGRPAGIRTHMLLVIGVTLLCECSKAFGGPDNSRIAAQIVTGVGFLGAGTIMRTGVEVKGLTTAASLWAAASIGFAVSTGGPFLLVAAVATALTLFTLGVVDNFERKFAEGVQLKDLTVAVNSREVLHNLLDRFKAKNWTVESVQVTPAEEGHHVQIGIRGPRHEVMREALDEEGVHAADWA